MYISKVYCNLATKIKLTIMWQKETGEQKLIGLSREDTVLISSSLPKVMN
jgi:hypothetical protein